MEVSLPTGVEMMKDANNLYINCLVCAMRIGVFNQQAQPERINELAREHITGDPHMTLVRIDNCFKNIKRGVQNQ